MLLLLLLVVVVALCSVNRIVNSTTRYFPRRKPVWTRLSLYMYVCVRTSEPSSLVRPSFNQWTHGISTSRSSRPYQSKYILVRYLSLHRIFSFYFSSDVMVMIDCRYLIFWDVSEIEWYIMRTAGYFFGTFINIKLKCWPEGNIDKMFFFRELVM